MVLLRKKHASVFQTFAIERVRVLENLANRLNSNLLSQNLLNFSLEAVHIKSVGELKHKN